MLSSTKKQLQVSRRTYGLGSDGTERSGRQGEASGEINEALNVRPKKQFLGREGKRRAPRCLEDKDSEFPSAAGELSQVPPWHSGF